ncbi:uncharacterized protein LOC128250544 [Octopus bimaculoides]|uniref:uncharacterized protein LOC128250544 n=1 Tax=Octopus bimaculoides TaxID=37653 RepID=UPI0022E1079A|nr:uncharacterized protein LOC128250544 [Octopus bimaculoides]
MRHCFCQRISEYVGIFCVPSFLRTKQKNKNNSPSRWIFQNLNILALITDGVELLGDFIRVIQNFDHSGDMKRNQMMIDFPHLRQGIRQIQVINHRMKHQRIEISPVYFERNRQQAHFYRKKRTVKQRYKTFNYRENLSHQGDKKNEKMERISSKRGITNALPWRMANHAGYRIYPIKESITRNRVPISTR